MNHLLEYWNLDRKNRKKLCYFLILLMVSAEAESDTMICFVQTLFSSKGNTGSEMGK